MGEQVATVHLIADFAAKEEVVRNAAREGLTHLTTWGSPFVTAGDVLPSVGSDVSDDQRRAVAEAAAREINKRNEAGTLVAEAAKSALRRIPAK